MRLTALLGCVAVAAACTAKESAPPADSTAAAPAHTVSLAHLAAIWNVTVKPEGKDSVVTTYILNTTDTTDWTFMFATDKKPIHQKIAGYRGDTLVLETDWFDSSVRPGMKAKTNSLAWEQDGKLVGKVTAHYQNAGADSVRHFVIEGIRQ